MRDKTRWDNHNHGMTGPTRQPAKHRIGDENAPDGTYELDASGESWRPMSDAAAGQFKAQMQQYLEAMREDAREVATRRLASELRSALAGARAVHETAVLAQEIAHVTSQLEREAARADQAKTASAGRWAAMCDLREAAGLLEAAAHYPDRGLLYAAAALIGAAQDKLATLEQRKGKGGPKPGRAGTKRAKVRELAQESTTALTGGMAAQRLSAGGVDVDPRDARRVLKALNQQKAGR